MLSSCAVLKRGFMLRANPPPPSFHGSLGWHASPKYLNVRMFSTQTELEDLTTPDSQTSSYFPREVVKELDRYIIGQAEAKKCFAIALRNRWRRLQLDPSVQKEIIPKNMLVVGSTGVGKTELARRVAKLCQAPFIKVEATNYTEVGFRGKDVDSMIVDLVELTIRQETEKAQKKVQAQVQKAAEEKILDLLCGKIRPSAKEAFRQMYRKGMLDSRAIDLDPLVMSMKTKMDDREGGKVIQIDLGKLFSGEEALPRKWQTVGQARAQLEKLEAQNMIPKQAITKRAIQLVEERGIVFIDEIDKVCVTKDFPSQDRFQEGVQKDLLALIEGTTVTTKHGNVDTSKILFIASGAFHSTKPSDLLSELQGRLPIRIQMTPLTETDFFDILTKTENNQIRQQIDLFATEGIELQVTEDACRLIAKMASELNHRTVNIGARRLHTIIEKLFEDLSFNCEQFKNQKVIIDATAVQKIHCDFLTTQSLERYII